MGFIIVIVFTRLLIFCHPFNLKILYFTLNSFRLFVSRLLTMVQVSETETMTMAEIKKMQKKLALLEEENIILKKAMAIFSRESGKE